MKKKTFHKSENGTWRLYLLTLFESMNVDIWLKTEETHIYLKTLRIAQGLERSRKISWYLLLG
jgi:hypothetical protein